MLLYFCRRVSVRSCVSGSGGGGQWTRTEQLANLCRVSTYREKSLSNLENHFHSESASVQLYMPAMTSLLVREFARSRVGELCSFLPICLLELRPIRPWSRGVCQPPRVKSDMESIDSMVKDAGIVRVIPRAQLYQSRFYYAVFHIIIQLQAK